MNLDFDLSGLGTTGSNPKKDDDNQNEEAVNLGDISISPEETTETTSSSSFDLDIGSYHIDSDNEISQETGNVKDDIESQSDTDMQIQGINQEQSDTYNLGLDSSVPEKIEEETVSSEDDFAEQEDSDESLDFKVSLVEEDERQIDISESAPTDSVEQTVIQQEQSTIIGGLKLDMPAEEIPVKEFENIEQGPELPPFVVNLETEESSEKNKKTKSSKKDKKDKTDKKGLFSFFKKNKKEKKEEQTMEQKIADIQASIQQPEDTEIVSPDLNIEEIPQAGVIPVEIPEQVQSQEEASNDAPSAPSRFSMDAQPKEKPKKESTFSASTIKLDLEEDKKESQPKEQSTDIFKKKGALFPQSQKEDSEKPVINILSEIAKTGVNLDETIDQKVEAEIFKTVQKKKKSKLMLKKVMTGVLGLVVIGGVGAGIYIGSTKNLFASILKSPDEAIQNTGTTSQTSDAKDKEIEALKAQLKNAGPQISTGDEQKIKDLETQVSQKDTEIENLKQNTLDEKTKEQLEKLKKASETYTKTLSEKNKAISALMSLKNVQQLSGVELLTKEEIESVKLANLYDIYIEDYSLIQNSNLGEGEKKTLLTQFNNNVFDLKDNKIDYKEFRLKYNAIVNKALDATK